MLEYLLLFIVSLATSFAANITGGGAALIIQPILIGLGLKPIDAIGTLVFGSSGFVTGSLFSAPARKKIRYDHVLPVVLIVAVSSLLGPSISIHLPQTTVKIISGIAIVTTAIASLLTWNMNPGATNVSQLRRNVGYGLYFVAATMVAGFASGIGLLSNYVLAGVVGLSTIETIIIRQLAGLVGVPIQLGIYASHHHVNYGYGLTLAVGFLIGAYLGINFAIKKGDEYVKRAMAAVAIILVALFFIK